MNETPSTPEMPATTETVKAGTSTSEFKFQGAAAIAALIPIVQSLISKQGDTTVEVICITVGVCVYNLGRVAEKIMAQRR